MIYFATTYYKDFLIIRCRKFGRRNRMAATQRRIAIIGTGFSGLCLGIQLKKIGVESFVIYEKADGIGGTWRENTYPGAECDIPSALYSFSFEKR